MIKSLIFYILLSIWTIFLGILFIPFLILPKNKLNIAVRIWIWGVLYLLKKICGLSYELRGIQYTNNRNAKIIASKHQSAFETLVLYYTIPKAIFIHKYELFFIPIFGLYLKKLDMVSINRSGRIKTLNKLLKKSKIKISKGYSLIIFPEGTRKKPGTHADYKSGVAGIYKELNTGVIPVAVNSGMFWPKNSLIIKSGKIIIEFLDPINEGFSKKDFLKILEERIENKTSELIYN